MGSVYTHSGLSACTGNGQPGSACDVEVPSFLVRFNVLNILFTLSTLLAPLAALLLAAPFVLDLEAAPTGCSGRRASRAAAGSSRSSGWALPAWCSWAPS